MQEILLAYVFDACALLSRPEHRYDIKEQLAPANIEQCTSPQSNTSLEQDFFCGFACPAQHMPYFAM